MSPPSVVQPEDDHTATVIFLHGRGGSGNGWPEHLQRKMKADYVKYVAPHAPVRPVSVCAAGPATAWFDEVARLPDGVDVASFCAAAKKVHKLIEREMAEEDLDSRRVVLGGFSEGGTLALYAGLTFGKPLGGIIAISCFAPPKELLTKDLQMCQRETPIFQGHGTKDYFVEISEAEESTRVLAELLPNTYQFHRYKDLEHDDNDEELEDIRKYLKKAIPPVVI